MEKTNKMLVRFGKVSAHFKDKVVVWDSIKCFMEVQKGDILLLFFSLIILLFSTNAVTPSQKVTKFVGTVCPQ